jgi:hypothetical protein
MKDQAGTTQEGFPYYIALEIAVMEQAARAQSRERQLQSKRVKKGAENSKRQVRERERG